MLFSSISFIYYFLPCALLLYYIVPKKFKNTMLLLFSLIFYFIGEPKYIILMLITIIITYFSARLIDRCKQEKMKDKSKMVTVVTVVLLVLFLMYFKYANFIFLNIVRLFKIDSKLLEIALPIGISFYIFQAISYIVDVYKGKVKVQKNFINLATYISMFPQLIAGPIVRYSDIEGQLVERKMTTQKFAEGIIRFVIGLSKKVLIANSLASLTQVVIGSNEKTVIYYWMYAISNMLYIYFDFSGYSDMAIGLGKMFGFEFTENFNYPYISSSITEFWRRWHISLGTWFRDYIYIPLGGSRVNKAKFIRNIIIVWALTGLWHGAEWNFLLWGLYFAVLLLIEKEVVFKFLKNIPQVLKIIVTLFLVMLGFVIFSANSLQEGLEYIQGLFAFNNINMINTETLYYLKSYAVVIIMAIIGATPLLKVINSKMIKNEKLNNTISVLKVATICILLIVSTAYIIDGSYNPFLYFRF